MFNVAKSAAPRFIILALASGTLSISVIVGIIASINSIVNTQDWTLPLIIGGVAVVAFIVFIAMFIELFVKTSKGVFGMASRNFLR
jgi:type III secretory pathway component EscS